MDGASGGWGDRGGYEWPGAVALPSWRALVPGMAHWKWGQRERGLAYLGAFACGLAMGVLAWGTAMGFVMLGLAFVAHVASVTDALRQSSFPGYARGTPVVPTVVGFGALCYGPMLVMATALAWPGSTGEGGGFLVNLRAYATTSPASGEWIYAREGAGSSFRVARVVAGPRQRVESSAMGLSIEGRRFPWTLEPTSPPPDLMLRTPADMVLVLESGGPTTQSLGLRLVPLDRVAGRAWACYYPLDKRCLLD